MLAAMAPLALACAVLGVAPQLAAPSLDAAARSFDPGLGAGLGAVGALGSISLAALVLLAGLAAIAAWARRRRAAPRAVTWDCGYAAPSPRMQYTSSSFALGLVDVFRWALWPQLDSPRLAGRPFPGPARLHTELPDPVLDRLTLPAGRWLVHASSWFRWFQRGRVHSYVLYILLAIVLGLWAARGELR
jgi:hydrogenase-4 component B